MHTELVMQQIAQIIAIIMLPNRGRLLAYQRI